MENTKKSDLKKSSDSVKDKYLYQKSNIYRNPVFQNFLDANRPTKTKISVIRSEGIADSGLIKLFEKP